MSEKRDTLPQGWEWKKLGDIVDILDSKRKPISQKDRIVGEYPYYGASGILDYINNYIFDEKLLLIGEDGAKWEANENTSFIAIGKYWVNNHAHVLKPKREIVLDEYLVYHLNHSDLSRYITGATVKKLNQAKLREIDIPLPPLEEQRRIVGVLDGLFSKIDKSIALLDESIASASSLMPSALNEVFEELGEKWEKKKLEECTFFQNGYAFKSQDFSETQKTFQVIRIGNVLDLNKNPVYIDEQKELERFRLYENDIVISMTGTRQKQDYLFVSLIQKAKYYLNQRVGKITAKSNSVSKFIFYYLQSRHFREKIFEFETGTVNQGNISGKDIMNMLIPLPPLDIQTQTVAYLDALHLKADALKKAQEKKKEALLALKASLLESAFKGAL